MSEVKDFERLKHADTGVKDRGAASRAFLHDPTAPAPRGGAERDIVSARYFERVSCKLTLTANYCAYLLSRRSGWSVMGTALVERSAVPSGRLEAVESAPKPRVTIGMLQTIRPPSPKSAEPVGCAVFL